MAKGWFYDIVSNLKIKFREYDPGIRNNGDYYHHDWVGPYRTFASAKRAGLKELDLDYKRAKNRYEEFSDLKERANEKT